MTRRKTPLKGETAHLTIRCNNKMFLLNQQKNFSGLISWLNAMHTNYNVSIHHVMIMSNHIHLLVTPKENNLGDALRFVISNIFRFINYENKSINHIFGGRYSPTVISADNHLVNVIRYIYQNPVRAGITANVFEYKFSSLNQYLGYNNIGLFLTPDIYTSEMFHQGIDGMLQWKKFVSEIFEDSDIELIRNSLKRREFKFSRRQYESAQRSQTNLLF